MHPYRVAIDQGSHSSRALVFDPDMRIVAMGQCPIETRTRGADVVEHDAEAIVASVQAAVAIALEQARLPRNASAVAAMATQRSTIVCWDRETARALTPAISWQDRRHAAWLDALRLDPAWVHARTGLLPSPHYGASKLRWCLDHLPAVAAAARTGRLGCGPLAAYLIRRLTREAGDRVDPANAARTLLWSIESEQWDDALLDRFGIESRWLPRTVPTRHPYGSLATTHGEMPLVAVSGDQTVVPYALGTPQPGTMYANLGTGVFLQTPTHTAVALPLLASRPCIPDAMPYIAEGTVNGAAAALSWFAHRHEVDVDALVRADEPGLGGGAEPPLFVNTVGGLGSPYWSTGLDPEFIGAGRAADCVAAILESIAFLIVENVGAFAEQGHAPRRLIATGGLAASDRVLRTLAAMLDCEILRSAEREATARGVATIAHAAHAPPAPEVELERIDPAPDPTLARRFQRWRAAMQEALVRRHAL